MAKEHLKLPEFDRVEKELELISSDSNVRLVVDFDDVNHDVVEELTKLIVKAVNNIPVEEWRGAVKAGRDRHREDH